MVSGDELDGTIGAAGWHKELESLSIFIAAVVALSCQKKVMESKCPKLMV